MKYEIITLDKTGTEIKLPISENGFQFCPVCGKKAFNKVFRAYDEQGNSYGICACGIEYGNDCNAETTEIDWKKQREEWLNETLEFGNCKMMSKAEKLEQLKNIGV